MPAPTRTPRSSWIDEGLKVLAEGGPDAVRIDSLAKALGVTRGGFYWHFDDRRALLDEMLDTWEHRSLDEVLERVEREGGAPEAKVRQAGMLTFSRELLPIDLAVRDWARRDRAVAARLRRVDSRRIEYMRSLFRQFSRDEDDVEVRCLLMISMWIGSNFIAPDHGSRKRREVAEMAISRLLEQA